MEGVRGMHAEYADDNCVWDSSKSLEENCVKMNADLQVIESWCLMWNMLIAPEKTEVILFTPGNESVDDNEVKVKFGGETLRVSKSKKVLGVIIDDKLNFSEHIAQKTKSAFIALRGIDRFVQSHRGCSQSTYMRLYKSLVLPIMEYGAAAIVGASSESCKELLLTRSAMIKASGCLNSTPTEALEILTNTEPIDLQLKLRQAQEVVRIASKHTDDPLREDFDNWVEGKVIGGRKPTVFQLLMSRFKEMKGTVEFDRIEKEFKYSKEYMGLIKERGKIELEEFNNSKDEQEENTKEFLRKCTNKDVLLFTDGSALGNPGPTGAGAVAYIDGYNSAPVLLKKGVSPLSNNYTGELVGIQIGLELLGDMESIKNRTVHVLTDCQPAIKTAFGGQIPWNKIDILLDIKNSISKINEKGNEIKVHWVPGHKDIEGNEIADRQAKEAAREMSAPDIPILPILDKKEAVSELKKQMAEKWQRKYTCSEHSNHIQEIFTEVGKRNCYGEKDRGTFSVLNQLLSGHTLLNSHRAKINRTVSELCETCQIKENTEHYLYHCDKYQTERNKLETTIEDIIHREDMKEIQVINLKVMIGAVDKFSREGQNELIEALMEFIRCTQRFNLH